MRKLSLSKRTIVGRVIAIALALGASAAPGRAQPANSRYSPRLGIYYRLERYGNAYAARLTTAPVPGSPMWQDQIQLEEGDRIIQLDGNSISGPNDLENHFAQTSVVLIDIRTGRQNTGSVYLPPMEAPGVPRPGARRGGGSYIGTYSPRLGIYYRLERLGEAFVARLTAAPVPGSPMWQDQIQLEEGDRIIQLDGNSISGPNDLENHFAQTSVTFLNVRTGQAEARQVFLPPMTAPKVPNPVGEPARPENLPVDPEPLPDLVEPPPRLPMISEIPVEIPTLFPLTTPSPRSP
jgi:hypothetical protein